MAFDMSGQSPIEGTPLDPNRKLWMRMAGAGGVGAGEAVGGEGMPTSPELGDLGQSYADKFEGDPTKFDEGGTAPAPAQPAAAMPMSAEASPESAQASSSAFARSRPTAPAGMPTDTGDEDSIFNRIMNSTMDNTPSSDRVNSLQAKYDEMHKPLTMKQKLLRTLVTVAPTAIGAAFGGTEGAAGAAGGTVQAENMLHDRREHESEILRQQIEGERGRQEHQLERQMQLPVTYMNMKMQRDYRNAMINAKTYSTDASMYKTDTTHADALTKMGLDPNGNPIPTEQLPAAARGRIEYLRAHQDLYDAQSQLAEAKEEYTRAQNDPNSPAFQLAKQKLDVANRQAQAAITRAGAMELSAKTREGQYNKSAFGTDINGNVLPGTFQDQAGNPMGWNAPGNPTANTKQRGQTAATVLIHFHTHADPKTGKATPGLMELVQATPDAKLGQLSGHFNEWWVGKWGGKDPALAALRDNMMLASSAMELSHVGQSGGIEMLNHFKSMLNMGQDKANLIAGLSTMEGWLRGYEQAGNAPTGIVGTGNSSFAPVGGEGAPRTVPTKGAGRLQRSASTAPAAGVVEWEKGPDGKPRRKVTGGR